MQYGFDLLCPIVSFYNSYKYSTLCPHLFQATHYSIYVIFSSNKNNFDLFKCIHGKIKTLFSNYISYVIFYNSCSYFNEYYFEYNVYYKNI